MVRILPVFFDDSIENVDGARRLGWHAFRDTDAQHARRDLADLGLRLGDQNQDQDQRTSPSPRN